METSTENIDSQAQLEKALSIIEAQQLTIQSLQLELIRLKKIIFGNSHERFTAGESGNAPTLFDVPPIADVVTLGTTTVVYEKTKTELQSNHKGRNGFPEHLRREEEIIYPEGIDPSSKRIGEDVTERLAYKSQEVFIKRLVRVELLDGRTNRIFQAPAPERTFEKSNVDTSLVAQVVVEKYVDHLPLYRQLKRYEGWE